jgi:hypothetical protein
MFEGYRFFFRNDFPKCPVYVAKDWNLPYTYIGEWEFGKFIPRQHIHYSYNDGAGLCTKSVREATEKEVLVIKLGYF